MDNNAFTIWTHPEEIKVKIIRDIGEYPFYPVFHGHRGGLTVRHRFFLQYGVLYYTSMNNLVTSIHVL